MNAKPKHDMHWMIQMHMNAAQMTLPAGRFFTPNEAFWSLFDRSGWREISWVDAGAGSGQLTDEAKARGLTMMAVDLHQREEQSACVTHVDALALPYNRHIWPLICRPNHSGWCIEVIEKALAGGATALYVSHEHNMWRDLEDRASQAQLIARNIGQHGEFLWQVGPGLL